MVGFAGLKTPYALFIIILMVLGIIATAFYFYNASSQNPCGNPGDAKFAALPAQTISVQGQPKTYNAVAANFTKTQQEEVLSNVAFYTTSFDDPTIAHVINGSCGTDPFTPATVTVRITFSSNGQTELLSLHYKGVTQAPVQNVTSNTNAAIYWDGGPSLILLAA